MIWYLIFTCIQPRFCSHETFALPTRQPTEQLCMMAGDLVLYLRNWEDKLIFRCELRDK